MLNSKSRILDKESIQSKIKRIAYQILENNFRESDLFLVGIEGGGAILAEKIKDELLQISDLNPKIIQLSIDKIAPENSEVLLSPAIQSKSDSVVILIDDVLNSGRTVFYALQPFLKIPVSKIETAFLVNRAHRMFPISANYTGIELATTIQEHITFSWKEEDFGVYLE